MRKIMMNSALDLLALLGADIPMIQGPGSPARRRGKGKGRVERIMGLHRRIFGATKPETKRRWHDPKDPLQAERIAAAQAKRERKAAKLDRDTFSMFQTNNAHAPNHIIPNRLNPFYVNREVSA